MRTLVIGLGNTILTDDGVGILVARAAALRWSERRLSSSHAASEVTFTEASVGGLRLLDLIAGFERVILVDAIQTPGGQAGQIYRLGPGDLRASLHSGSTHDLSLPGALALGRDLGLALPSDEQIVIIAIEVADVLTFGERCTPEVSAAIPRAVGAVLEALEPEPSAHRAAAPETGQQPGL